MTDLPLGRVSFDDLVTTATVGLSRRPLPAHGHASLDDADVLLDLAARHAIARRAGMLAPRGMTVPPPMTPDPAPELPIRAAQVLRRVTSDHELLADLLNAAAGAGYRAPAPLLPALLDAGARTVALRPAISATLGTRGRWLAAHRAEWRRVAGADPAGPASESPRAWETGTRAERAGYLAALRDRDPAAARDLLAAGWARETAEERAQLLGVLARHLSADDEDLLDAALDDRSAGVRAAARRLLSSLPKSAFSQRAAERAAHVLRLRHDRRHRWLEATLPAPEDLPESEPGIGQRALLLTRLIAAAPLAEWSARWGLSAAEIVSLDIRAADRDLTADVHAGWRLAAVSQASAEWAKAILTGPAPLLAPDRPESSWPPNYVLAGLLDPATRAALAAGVFPRVSVAEMTAWPGPWPQDVADFVMSMVSSSITTQGSARALQGLLASAARRVPVTGPRDHAAELIRLTHRPDCAYPWLSLLRRAADTITLRRAFAEAVSSAT